MASITSRRSRRGGFTLVEVTLAMGVLAFAATAIMGLLSVSFTQMRGSIDRGRSQGISQELLVEAKQTTFSALCHKGTYRRYYTEEGARTNEGDPSVVYTAQVSVDMDRTTGAAKPTSLPGGDAAQSSLVTVTVSIRKTGSSKWDTSPDVGTYIGMVACRDLSDFTKR